MLNERWAAVRGYEGRYEVSDWGRVRSVSRFRKGKAGSLVPVSGRVMALRQKKPNGRTRPYVEVCLRDGSSRDVSGKNLLVHRLVAQAFVADLGPGLHVDHIDGDHANNHWANLRVLSAADHGRLHPCVADPVRNASMQASAQAAVKALRQSGRLVGRHRVLEAA